MENNKPKLKWYQYLWLSFIVLFFGPNILYAKRQKRHKESEKKFHEEYEVVGYEKGYIGFRSINKTIYRKRKNKS